MWLQTGIIIHRFIGLFLPFSNFFKPVRPFPLVNQRNNLLNKVLHVTNQTLIYYYIFIDFTVVYIYLNDGCFISKLLHVLCDSVAKTRPESKNQICLIHSFI